MQLWYTKKVKDNLAREDMPAIPPEQWGPGYRLWQSILNLLAQRGPEGATPLLRMGSHLVILLVAVIVLWVSRIQLPELDIAEAPSEQVNVEVIDAADVEGYVEAIDTGVEEEYALVRAAVPDTIIPERARLDIITHTVVAGDSLYGIAKKYKLSAETVMFANGLERNPDLLRLGQKLTILPIDGIYHTVAKNDTIDKIAKTYKVTADAIIKYALNKLDARNPTIVAGQKLIVPGGKKTIPVPQVQVYRGAVPAGAKKGTGRFVWPTSGYVTQGFKPYHRALDIARAIGTPVKASDSGYVVVAGWSNVGYGNYIVIDHGNGFQTLYGHLSRIFVQPGDVVGQGAIIGHMGNTGRSTGPHLHFEIRKGGVQLNPLSYLP